jgi:hypothetical protein
MTLEIKKQEKFSRGQLLLRTFFGFIYIWIPHLFIMMFVAIWAAILGFLAFWAVLFTGKYPKGWFDFQVKMISWGNRFLGSVTNLFDGYPAIGVGGTNPNVTLSVSNPATLSRGLLILRLFFSIFYVGIPHGFCLYFRMIWGAILGFIAWFVILFTGKYPQSWFEFQVGTMRWSNRVTLYSQFMTDEYPPFSGK